MNSKAGQYADYFGFQNLAEQGRGREFTDNLLTTAFRRMAQGAIQERTQMGSRFIDNGMQFSGVGEVKAPNMLTAGLAESALSTMNQVNNDEQNFMMQMRDKYINVLQHEDNYNLQRERLDFEKQQAQTDLFDVIGKISSIFVGASAAKEVF